MLTIQNLKLTLKTIPNVLSFLLVVQQFKSMFLTNKHESTFI